MLKHFLHGGILTHLFFIFLFLIVPTLAFVRTPGESFFTFSRVIIQDTLANFILLCFFYLNYYVLLPKFYLNRKYFLYALFVILFISLTFPLPHFITNLLPGVGKDLPPFRPGDIKDLPPRSFGVQPPLFSFSFDEFRRHLYLFFTAIFLSFLLKTREHVSQLKEEKLNAELSSLKAQINPHFLFNTLNSIYALSIKKDERASDAIIHLSGLMRYTIKDANDYKIPLQKEVDYINNYIELQRARLGNTVDIHFDCNGEFANNTIAPLILITYIENAFKYGVNPDVTNCIVNIKLQVTNSNLVLTVFNIKVPLSALADSAGIGMQNTKERLRHLYPKKYTLEIQDDKDSYSVKLSIKLT